MVDRNLLEFVSRANPAQIKRYMKDDKLPAIMFFIEFDDPSDRARKKKIKKVAKLLEKNASDWVQSDDLEEQDNMWAIRRSAWAVLTYDGAASRAVPAIEDGVVPPEKFAEYIQKTYTLFSQHHLPVAVWGSVGSGQFKVHPFLDLSRLGDRQRVFKLMEDYYSLIISLGGSISAAHGDGRARGIYLEQLYGKDMFDLFVKVKQIFDPHNILNPGVKVGATKAESMALVRKEYSTSHLSDYLIHN
jgi:FAD/FMN-containing dehydrogenase